MKITNNIIFYFVFLLILCCASCSLNRNQTKSEKHDWKLSMKSYTFHLFTGIEALEKTHDLGIKYIEMSANQRIGGDIGDDKFDYRLSLEKRQKLKEIAKTKGIKIVSTSMSVPRTDEWEEIFAFAKDMDMEYITVEPAIKDWPLVEDLAEEYDIKIACHNHPSKKSYWKPEILLDNIQNRSNLLGACCDIGHYKRMYLDPIECLRKLEGRIFTLDFKDVGFDNSNTSTCCLIDVVWGHGILNIKGIMEELKKQNFDGYITIEYEEHPEDNIPEIKKSIEYFNRIADQIL